MRCAFDNVASAVRRSAWERFPFGPRKFGEDIWFGMRAITAGLSLAHQGVLFLDELPEYKRTALEVLRQPIEDKTVTVSRAAGSFTFPAAI